MPISSHEIAQIIGQQEQAFRALFGRAPGDPLAMTPTGAGNSLGGFSLDPTVASYGETRAGLASGVVGAASGAAAGVALAADFGYAPSVLSPFSGTLAAAQAGFKAAGVAGGIGLGAAAFGGYAAFGAAASPVLNAFNTGAQQYGQLSGVMNAMYGTGGAGAAGAMLSDPSIGRNAFAYMQAAHAAGVMPAGSDPYAAVSAVQGYAAQAGSFPGMGVQDAMSAMIGLRGAGVAPGAVPGLLSTMHRVGSRFGMSPGEGLEAVAGGVQLGVATGINPDQAARDSFMTASVARAVIDSGRVPGLRDMGALNMATSRFLSGHLGTQTLAAAMDPETGNLDVAKARDIASGAFSGREIREMAERNLSGHRDLFYSSRQELAGSFMSKLGAGGVGGALSALTSDSSMPTTAMQNATGLNTSQLDQLLQFGSLDQDVRADVHRAAASGLASGMQNRSLTDVIRLSVGAIRLKVEQAAQSAGRAIYSGVESAFGEVSSAFYGDSHIGGMAGGVQDFRAAFATGDGRAMSSFGAASEALGDPTTRYGAQVTGLGRRFIPPAFRLAGMSPGTSPSDLTMYGMALDQHNPVYTGIAGAAMLGAVGFNPVTMAGSVLSGVGRGAQSFLGGRGLGKAVGAIPRGAGALTRGAGRVMGSPLVAAGLVGMDLMFNELPHIGRQLGALGPGYDITGFDAQNINFMESTGLVRGGSLLHSFSPSGNIFDDSAAAIRSDGGMFVQPVGDIPHGVYTTSSDIERMRAAQQDLMGLDVSGVYERVLGGGIGMGRRISDYRTLGMKGSAIQRDLMTTEGLTGREAAAVFLQKVRPDFSSISFDRGFSEADAGRAITGILGSAEGVGKMPVGAGTSLNATEHQKALGALLGGLDTDRKRIAFAEMVASVNRRVGRHGGIGASNVDARHAAFASGLQAIDGLGLEGALLATVSGGLARGTLGAGREGGAIDLDTLSAIPAVMANGNESGRELEALTGYDRRSMGSLLGATRSDPGLSRAVEGLRGWNPTQDRTGADAYRISQQMTDAVLAGDFSPEELNDLGQRGGRMRSGTARDIILGAVQAGRAKRIAARSGRDPLRGLSSALGITRRSLDRMFRKEDLAIFESEGKQLMTSGADAAIQELADRFTKPNASPQEIEAARAGIIEFGRHTRAGDYDAAARALQRAGLGNYSGASGVSSDPTQNMARLSQEAGSLATSLERIRANMDDLMSHERR